ncbi:MAG: hypothetical protein IKQ96_03980 [Lachnospiraceae bacterium]|nr:hypothetical protein [Lachnospiraceae bacterium]
MAVRWTTKEISQLSNVCYNRGLEKAQVRDMEGAILELKRCLQLNKNHIDARNLLGLVYYEIGEMADALAEWVISTNLQARGNQAIGYIGKLQEKQEFLNEMVMASKNYNQALTLLGEESDDLAILQLNKVIRLNPHYVKAYQLLALVYIKHHSYAKAERSIKKALAIDNSNALSLRYLNELKRIANARKKGKLEDLTKDDSAQFDTLSGDDVIIPTYHGDVLGGWLTVVNLLVGILIGLACFYFMVLPAQLSGVSASYNRKLVEINQSHDAQDAQVEALTGRVANLEEQLKSTTDTWGYESRTSQAAIARYQALLDVLAALDSNVPEVYLSGVTALQEMDLSDVTEETYLSVHAAAQARVQGEIAGKLLEWGKVSLASGDYEAALTYLMQSLQYNSASPETIYYVGQTYKMSGNSTDAIIWFTRVVNDYPEDPFAEMARVARDGE